MQVNKYKFIFLISFLWFALINDANANSTADSLKTVWNNKSLHDTTRIVAYSKYIRARYVFSNPDSAYYHGGKLLSMSKKANYDKGIISAYNIQGTSFFFKGQLDSGRRMFEKCLQLNITSGREKKIASSYGNLGAICMEQGDYARATDYFFKSLKLHQKFNVKEEEAGCLNNIGILFNKQNNIEKSLEYFLKAKDIQELTDNPRLKNFTLNNLGQIYFDKKEYEKALDYHRQSLALSKELDDRRGTSVSLINMGLAFKHLAKYDSALLVTSEALIIDRELNYKNGEAKSVNNLSSIYMRMGQFEKAKKYSLESMQISQKYGLNEPIKNAAQNLHEIYDTLGEYKNAYEMYKRYVLLADSLEGIESQRRTLNNDFQYKFEKQALEDSLNLASQQQIALIERRSERYTWIGLCLFAGIGGAVYFRIRSLKVKNEKNMLLQEIKLLKGQSIVRITPNLTDQEVHLDKEKIESEISKPLNPSDWKILNVLCENPTITNRAIADEVGLSIQGVNSSLKKMYQLFDLKKQKENQRIAMVAKCIRLSQAQSA